MRSAVNIVLALACAGLAAASIDLYVRDRTSRLAGDEFARAYEVTIRRPDVADSSRLAPSADIASDLFADSALRDAIVPVNLSKLPPEQWRAWLDAVGRLDEELVAGQSLMLDAVAMRPGWPYHQTLLGQLEYTRGTSSLSPDLVQKSERWSMPLLTGARAVDSDPVLWQSLALAYLQTWPELAKRHAATAPAVFRRAFEDEEFVKNAFGPAVQLIGTKAALSALPDSAAPLLAAFDAVAKTSDVATALQIHRRWEGAEWRQRGVEITNIENQIRRGDIDGARTEAERWGRLHSPWEFESVDARKQIVHLLELWPGGVRGQWPYDRRGVLVRYLLTFGTDAPAGPALTRALTFVEGVPAIVQGQAALHAVSRDTALPMWSATDDQPVLEWLPYVFDVTRLLINRGDVASARAQLDRVKSVAAGTCDFQLLNSVISNGGSLAAENSTRITISDADVIRVPACVDRRTGDDWRVSVQAGSPVIADLGWDGRRSGTFLINEGASDISLSKPESGRHELGLRVRMRQTP